MSSQIEDVHTSASPSPRAQKSKQSCSCISNFAEIINLFGLTLKPIQITKLSYVEIFFTYLCLFALLAAAVGFMTFATSNYQVPTYQYALSVKDATPQWRLCDANNYFYDEFFTKAQLKVDYDSSINYPSIASTPNVNLVYNYDIIDSYNDPRTRPCQCSKILKRKNVASSGSALSHNYNNGDFHSVLFKEQNLVLCAPNGNTDDNKLVTYQGTNGLGATLLSDVTNTARMIISIGDFFTTLDVNESKIIRVGLTITYQQGVSNQVGLSITSEQSFGTQYACVQQKDRSNQLIPSAYDITFKSPTNTPTAIPCLRILTDNKVIYIQDGMNSYLLFTAFISFFGGAISLLIACFGGTSHFVRRLRSPKDFDDDDFNHAMVSSRTNNILHHKKSTDSRDKNKGHVHVESKVSPDRIDIDNVYP